MDGLYDRPIEIAEKSTDQVTHAEMRTALFAEPLISSITQPGTRTRKRNATHQKKGSRLTEGERHTKEIRAPRVADAAHQRMFRAMI